VNNSDDSGGGDAGRLPAAPAAGRQRSRRPPGLAPFPRGITERPRGQQFLAVVGRIARQASPSRTAARRSIRIARTISREFTEYGTAGRSTTPSPCRRTACARSGRAAGAPRRSRHPPPDRVRERSQPPRRPARRPAEGDRPAHRTRGRPRPPAAPVLVEGLLLSALRGRAGLARGPPGTLGAGGGRVRRPGAAWPPRASTPRCSSFTGGTALLWGLLLSLAPLAEVFRANLVTALQRRDGIDRRDRAPSHAHGPRRRADGPGRGAPRRRRARRAHVPRACSASIPGSGSEAS
jgi:hypothetical protein